MKRNFAAESVVNKLMRARRAAAGRLRGRLLSALGAFHPLSGKALYFGSGPRFINTRAIQLGANVSFGINARLEYHGAASQDPGIIIGDHSSFGDYSHIGAMDRVQIGCGVLGGSNILIVDHSHGSPRRDLENRCTEMPRERPLSGRGPVVIGDNVWIGDQVVILSGVTIGEGAIIAAQSVVRNDVAAFSLFTGSVPAGSS